MTHTREEQLEAIRRKCMVAKWGEYYLDATDADERHNFSPSLADVLLAIGRAENDALRPFPRDAAIDARGMLSAYFSLTDKRSECWNLRKDDIREQSDETVEFIDQLLQ
jgi:hypothetical protein